MDNPKVTEEKMDISTPDLTPPTAYLQPALHGHGRGPNNFYYSNTHKNDETSQMDVDKNVIFYFCYLIKVKVQLWSYFFIGLKVKLRSLFLKFLSNIKIYAV